MGTETSVVWTLKLSSALNAAYYRMCFIRSLSQSRNPQAVGRALIYSAPAVAIQVAFGADNISRSGASQEFSSLD
jgi:hypothetical protein